MIPITRCSALAFLLQVELFDHLFAMIKEPPLFGVMIGVNESKYYAMHVPGILADEVGRVNKIEGDGSSIRRS